MLTISSTMFTLLASTWPLRERAESVLARYRLLRKSAAGGRHENVAADGSQARGIYETHQLHLSDILRLRTAYQKPH